MSNTMQTTVITPEVCMHCGMIHTMVGQCPKVKAVEYYENGMIKRVEYNDWPMATKPAFDANG